MIWRRMQDIQAQLNKENQVTAGVISFWSTLFEGIISNSRWYGEANLLVCKRSVELWSSEGFPVKPFSWGEE